MRPDGNHILVGLGQDGSLTFQVSLPARGHAAAAHPYHAEVVATARRPGTYAVVIDCAQGLITQQLMAPKGRHFYGHATFSADGAYLFTTENAYDSGLGRIGVWDRAQGFKRVDEFSSGGIGPHEIIVLPNGDLAVANGGIRTHPASGRDKLNLDTMRSNLTILSGNGIIIDQAFLPEGHGLNSLRHIAALPDGTIGCGCQWQGDLFETAALFAIYSGGSLLDFPQIDEAHLRSMQGYIGSVAGISRSQFVVTSPRGNTAVVMDAAGNVLSRLKSYDVCGVVATPRGETLMSNGGGAIHKLSANSRLQIAQHDLAFDNHLVGLNM
ncbi:MAG: DUF1513 domain-containing protein [Pseudomonadota bacterium]